MLKHSRRANRRNFADEGSVATQAVATANLVSILDPAKVDADGIELIADATGTQAEFVENLTTLVDEANEAVATVEEAEVLQNYSNKVRDLCAKAKCHRNFSEGISEEAKITDAAEIVSMVDGEALECVEAKEIAETISEATGADETAVEAIVEVAKDNFSAGMAYAQKKQRKIGRQNFAHIAFNDVPAPTKEDPEDANTAPAHPKAEPKADDPIVESGLPKTGSEGLKQNPELAKNDPTPETAVEDLSAAPAGEAMAVQNELATVQGVTDVPEASSNFSRTQHQNAKTEEDCSLLQSLLGKDFVQ